MATATTAPAPAAGRAVATASTLGLALVAWLALFTWESSAYGRWLDHEGLAGSGLGAPVLLGVFVGGWVLMLVAMMVPTTVPLVGAFNIVVRGRSDRGVLLGALLAGYVAVWTAIGLIAFAGDALLHALEHRVGVLEEQHWVLSAGALAVAGAYQLSSLKERCLTRCRSPRLVVFAHWRGQRPVAEAWALGVDHGRSCAGCCWALMLLMFGIGAGSVGWMLAVGAAMAVEKTAPWGAAITVPLGTGLLAAAGALAITNV